MLANNLIIWWVAQVAAIVILVWLFLAWKPGFTGGKSIRETVGSLLRAREDQIRAQLEAAEASRREAAQIREQSALDIDRARQEADEIVTRAAQTSQAIKQGMQESAREEYERIVAQARVEIGYERERAELALRRRAGDIVVDAASQIVAQNLQPETDRRLIEGSLDDLRKIG
jgi:F-type H+-transporting ATPase subunit b